MRNIIFRGKRADNGEMVFGSLVNNTHRIVPDSLPAIIYEGSDGCDACEVKPETIGQFTGLTDCNGTPIYEHDIIVIPEVEGFLLYVCFNDKTASFCLVEVAYSQDLLCGTATLGEMLSHYRDAYVNGNIHDNPEFIKKVK